MRQVVQFLGLMACGLLIAGAALFLTQTPGVNMLQPSTRSAAGIDYMSFGIGLATGLTLAEIARLSWSDMPRRAIAWLIANRGNAKYLAYAAVSIVVLFYI
jgi:hypothetical protein